jgi:hypothetical protein
MTVLTGERTHDRPCIRQAGRKAGAGVEDMKQPLTGAILLAATLAGCKPEPEGPPRLQSGDNAIACALGGEGKFATACKVERSLAGDTLILIVRHPDGAFRRFEVLRDGRGVAVADGAEEAALSMNGAELEVAVGLDRYRFPARHTGNAAKP